MFFSSSHPFSGSKYATIGLADDCRLHALDAIERAEPRGLHSLAAWARSALGLLALGRGEPRDAVRWFNAIADVTARGSAGEPGALWWQADWVEALWSVGDQEWLIGRPATPNTCVAPVCCPTR